MTVITVYSTPDCHLCVEALATLRALQAELAFVLQECDITAEERLHRAYFERIPVIALDGEELFDYFVDEAVLRERLGSAVRPSAERSIL
jgi:glutaredoxin